MVVIKNKRDLDAVLSCAGFHSRASGWDGGGYFEDILNLSDSVIGILFGGVGWEAVVLSPEYKEDNQTLVSFTKELTMVRKFLGL